MIAKKDKKADLERKRFAFFQIGLIVSGSLCLAAFEYSSAHTEKEIVQNLPPEGGLEIEDVPRIDFKEKLPEQTKTVDPDVDTFNIVKHLPNPSTFAKKTSEIIAISEGTGEEEYGFGIIPEDITYEIEDIDRMPEFPGGETEMYKWISKQVVYPEMAAEMGIQGTVYVGFVVKKDGSIGTVKALKEQHKDLINEAIRVVKKMPKWTPGEVAGKNVSVHYKMPFMFSLH